MKRRPETPQPSLFDAEQPCVALTIAQESELATVTEVLLREIAAALAMAASRESSDDKDHA
jgi:hypothetical protein